MSSEEMSREEKEALLNIRMEQIRKKNAELQKRYEEVKADKQNAEEISDTFKETHRNVADEPRVRRTPQKPPERQRENRNNEGRAPQRTVPEEQEKRRLQRTAPEEQEKRRLQRTAPDEQEKKRPQRFTEEDGPPPDPSYSFLADRSREGNNASAQDRRRDSRRHPGNFGGKDFENVRSTMEYRRGNDRASPRQPPQSKMEMSMRMTGRERCEYERWRSERTKIEHDRMNRQKTTSGEWKREWDREKHGSDEPEEASPSNRWGPRTRGGSRGDRGSRGSRGSRQWLDQEQRQPCPKSPEPDDAPTPRENQSRQRRIQLNNENINVSFRNDQAAPVNRTWRTSSDRRSTSSREYSSSVSEDERPSSGQRSKMWCDRVKSPKSKKPPIAEDSVFENEKPQRDRNPKVEQGAIEQRVVFVDSSIQPLHEMQPEMQVPQADDVPDDASWDDEGSWEEDNSGNESQELSQHSQRVSETELPGNTDRTRSEVDAVTPSETSKLEVSAGGVTASSQPESRESTPVAEVQEVLNAELEQIKVLDPLGEMDYQQPKEAEEIAQNIAEIVKNEESSPLSVELPHMPTEANQQPVEPPRIAESCQQPVESQQTEESSQQHVEFPQVAETSQQPVESQQDKESSQQDLESPQIAESSQQPVESQQTEESSQQHVESPQVAETSQQPVESRQTKESSQQHVESPQIAESSSKPVEPQQTEESSHQHLESPQVAESSQQSVESQQTEESSHQHLESPQVAESSQQSVEPQQTEESSHQHLESPQVAESSQQSVESQQTEESPQVVESQQILESSQQHVESQQIPESSQPLAEFSQHKELEHIAESFQQPPESPDENCEEKWHECTSPDGIISAELQNETRLEHSQGSKDDDVPVPVPSEAEASVAEQSAQ